MSVKQCCRLCCTPCIEYELLQNEVGDSNDIYEITVKYFDPMLLTEEENSNDDSKFNVLCHNCWQHISDFHEFQRTVLLVRNSLEKCNTISQMETVVKKEVNQENKAINDKIEDDEHSFDFGSEKNDYDGFSDDNSLINDDDDEKPLITLKKPMKEEQIQIDEDIVEEKTSFETDVKFLSIQVKQEDDQSEVVTSIRDSEHYSKNEETFFEDNYLEIENVKIESPTSSDGIPIKISMKEKVVQKRIEDSEKHKVEVKIRHDNKPKISNRKSIKSLEEGSSSTNLEKSRESDAIIAEWKPELVCDLCSKTANNFHELRTHFKENHKTTFYIKCCERKFFRRNILVNHIKLHLNPETHKCDICGKTSSTKSSLKVHKKVVHEDTKQLKCDICEKLFKQKGTLERHLLIHATGNKDFICSECGKGFVVEKLLKLHINHVHNVDRVCNQCGKTIHGYQALKRHRMEHSGIERPKFPCDECGLELKYYSCLKRHKATCHNDGSTIYICGVCGKVAPSENALLSHKKLVHVAERKHKCTYCEKAFKRAKSLREHIATHTGEDLYQCPHCPQTFKVDANMYHHQKKVHPVEWEEGRKNRIQHSKVNRSKEKKQIVIC